MAKLSPHMHHLSPVCRASKVSRATSTLTKSGMIRAQEEDVGGRTCTRITTPHGDEGTGMDMIAGEVPSTAVAASQQARPCRLL